MINQRKEKRLRQRVRNLVVLFVLTISYGQAASAWLRWTGRAAVCAASAYQGYQASRAVDVGLREMPKWSIGVVGGVQCGLSLWSASRSDHSTLRTLINVGAAGAITGFGVHDQFRVHDYQDYLLRSISGGRQDSPSACILKPGCARYRN